MNRNKKLKRNNKQMNINLKYYFSEKNIVKINIDNNENIVYKIN